jgi:hypothetical protein
MNTDALIVAKTAERVLPLARAKLGDEYYYQSVPLCFIDAVWSLGVRYEGVRNVIAHYSSYFKLQRTRSSRDSVPAQNEQESTSHFCESAEKIGPAAMATVVFKNAQRTSPINGILKSEGVYRFASVLRKHKVEYLQDVKSVINSSKFESDIMAIPGQTKGKSLKYFFMLSGSDDLIKPDRMILAFLENALGRTVSSLECQSILSAACGQLASSYRSLTPRLLDHEIWKYQREKA